MVLVMIQFLYLRGYSKTFAEMNYTEKLKIDHRKVAYQKLFKKLKFIFDKFIFF